MSLPTRVGLFNSYSNFSLSSLHFIKLQKLLIASNLDIVKLCFASKSRFFQPIAQIAVRFHCSPPSFIMTCRLLNQLNIHAINVPFCVICFNFADQSVMCIIIKTYLQAFNHLNLNALVVGWDFKRLFLGHQLFLHTIPVTEPQNHHILKHLATTQLYLS